MCAICRRTPARQGRERALALAPTIAPKIAPAFVGGVMQDYLTMAAVLVVWFVLQRWVLPKLGVPT